MKYRIAINEKTDGTRLPDLFFLIVAVFLSSSALGQKIPEIVDDSFGYNLPGPEGVAVWTCEATYKVGQHRALPAQVDTKVRISAARNEYEPFQVVLKPDVPLTNLTASVSDFVRVGSPVDVISSTNVEICVVEYVPVIEPSDVMGMPGDWPDPILPLSGVVAVSADINQPFWMTVHVPKQAPAGVYESVITFMADNASPFSIVVHLRVFDFTLSDVTHTRSSYYAHINDYIWNYGYSVPSQTVKRQMYDLYLQDFRKHRISPSAAHLYSPITWQLVDDDFEVDFADFDAAMSRYLDEFDFSAFNIFGKKAPPFPLELGGHAAYSPGYNELLYKLLAKISQHLREKGWADKAYVYVYDEPPKSVYPDVYACMDAIQTGAPDLRRMLTGNQPPGAPYDPGMEGRVDIWTSVLSTAIQSQFLERQKYGEENWWYAAVGPQHPFPNVFIDHPAINQRIRIWAMEKHGLTGDLYWATTYWSGRNPWEETRTWSWSMTNGDGTLLYPSVKTPPSGPVIAPPADSIRWELTREAFEDMEYFWLAKELVRQAQVRIGPDHPDVMEVGDALTAALNLVTNIANFVRPDYTQDPQELYAARERLGEAMENLYDGAPFIVKSPHSQAVASGATATLHAEALGWPLPRYQWLFNGRTLPGETNSFVVISNCNPTVAGIYTVTASNTLGSVTSAVARIEGYWSEQPRILYQPEPVVQYEGEKAVMTVTAVSKNELSYQWLHEGVPVTGAVSNRASLLLTNLTVSLAGDYSVVVSNSAGAVTSDVARLTVLWESIASQSLVSAGGIWRYHDQGVDLGTAWRTPGYDDSGWGQGSAPLGYGNGDETTTLGTNTATVYFRKTFMLADAPDTAPLTGQFRADDGIAVYLNGTEAFHYNLPSGAIDFSTSAMNPVEGAAENTWLSFSVPVGSWQAGTNILAVEIHQYDETPSLPPGPVAFWTMDETNAPWSDLIGGHDLAAVGTGIGTQAGYVGGCVTNHSNTGWLEAPDAPDLQYDGPFTVGGWFAFTGSTLATPAEITCLEKEDEFRLYYSGHAINRYRFRVGSVEVQEQTAGTGLNQWRFVVAWYDGTNSYIQMDHGTVYSAPASPPAATASPLVLLRPEGALGQFALDEVFMFKRVLSDAERETIYSSGLRAFINPSSGGKDLVMDFSAAVAFAQPPQVLESPINLVRWEGQNAAFQSSVVSGTPLSYQWLFENTAIPGATEPFLYLSSVMSDEAGLYELKVSNAGGTAYSDPALLNVLPWPVIQPRWSGSNSAFEVVVPVNPGTWQILSSSNLVDWSVMGTVPPGMEPIVIMDEDTTNAPVRFYKLELR